jgi:hypothetical protein
MEKIKVMKKHRRSKSIGLTEKVIVVEMRSLKPGGDANRRVGKTQHDIKMCFTP